MRKPVYISAIIVGLSLAFVGIDRNVPAQHLHWRSLNPEAPIGIATKSQLLRLSLSPSASCMEMAQNTSFLSSTKSDPKTAHATCGWKISRQLHGVDHIAIEPKAPDMQCPLTLASAIWLKDVDRSAQNIMGQKLARIHHFGTYSCRRQNGNNSGAWSEHAFANAWDISAFELENGDIISVKNDWDGAPKAKQFLRDVRKSACRVFRVTLSPDFNAAHHDHFHFDMGPNTACR